jgi:adenylosuccinate synthase
MAVTAVVGAGFGDEGKGRVVDVLAEQADFVVRFQGGANAGHTLIGPLGKLVLHQLPSGVLSARALNVLGPGVALDLLKLLAELDALRARGIEPRLAISNRAQLVLPHHVVLDACEEARLGARAFGSTRSGIAPFYADKHAKLGVSIDDCADEARLAARIACALETKRPLFATLYREPAPDPDSVARTLRAAYLRVEPLLCDTSELLRAALDAGRSIVLEGQLGALRDPDHGIYPFVTSSSPLAGFASVGAGIPPWAITRVVAVSKAYASAVGAGSFPTELHGDEAAVLRARGGDAGEYGATTGRPRRVGAFDAVATRYACRVQGATEVALTCLDVLGYMPEIAVCTAYRIGARITTEFPTPRELERAEPIYERIAGWRSAIGDARVFSDLPREARAYIARLEQLIGCPIRRVSVGPQRDRMLDVPEVAVVDADQGGLQTEPGSRSVGLRRNTT